MNTPQPTPTPLQNAIATIESELLNNTTYMGHLDNVATLLEGYKSATLHAQEIDKVNGELLAENTELKEKLNNLMTHLGCVSAGNEYACQVIDSLYQNKDRLDQLTTTAKKLAEALRDAVNVFLDADKAPEQVLCTGERREAWESTLTLAKQQGLL